jgi:hypothetical protein
MNNLKFPYLVVLLFASLVSLNSMAEQKSKSKVTTPVMSEDEKKFEELKNGTEQVWTCENNVKLKTLKIQDKFILLWNKKLHTMGGINALNGVSHFQDNLSKLDYVIIPNKAMLFDTKSNQRLLDYCKTPEMASSVVSQDNDLMK